MPARWMVVAGAAIAGAIAGLLVGWSLWGAGERKVQEVYAKEEVQKDGSILAEKKPGALRPAPVLPKGATVERVIQVKVKPNATPTVGTAIPGSGDQSAPELPTTTLDLTLVKLADGTRRVVLKSPDGTIQGAVDSPMLLEAPTKARVWALGAVLGAGEGGRSIRGLSLERDLGPVRVGVDALRCTQSQQRPSWEGLVRVMLRW